MEEENGPKFRHFQRFASIQKGDPAMDVANRRQAQPDSDLVAIPPDNKIPKRQTLNNRCPPKQDVRAEKNQRSKSPRENVKTSPLNNKPFHSYTQRTFTSYHRLTIATQYPDASNAPVAFRSIKIECNIMESYESCVPAQMPPQPPSFPSKSKVVPSKSKVSQIDCRDIPLPDDPPDGNARGYPINTENMQEEAIGTESEAVLGKKEKYPILLPLEIKLLTQGFKEGIIPMNHPIPGSTCRKPEETIVKSETVETEQSETDSSASSYAESSDDADSVFEAAETQESESEATSDKEYLEADIMSSSTTPDSAEEIDQSQESSQEYRQESENVHVNEIGLPFPTMSFDDYESDGLEEQEIWDKPFLKKK